MVDDGKRNEGSGHPLPESEEARHEEIPEHLEREKGHGDDGRSALEPGEERVAPDGESYELRRDQAAHQDRGQAFVEDADRP